MLRGQTPTLAGHVSAAQPLIIHKLGFNPNYFMFTLILLINRNYETFPVILLIQIFLCSNVSKPSL